ncbi:ZIP family metal transporter [Cytobacillus oceanisediminis]|uniref:ZIP family metal transporter n=1 Tax=Cytobacillus oceanisediminis TaxID=665099 RepID=UPI00203AF947|nr:ZIP family metal transporter [Cytobacillus oceanisediminis]MCM3402866.1 ZIP family metal transporter [Cytobacillus oceanisediminis]
MGATAALFLIEIVSLQSSILAISLSLTAGIFLYIALTDLLPVVNATEDRPIILFFFWGIFLNFGLHWMFEQLAPHIH